MANLFDRFSTVFIETLYRLQDVQILDVMCWSKSPGELWSLQGTKSARVDIFNLTVVRSRGTKSAIVATGN